MVTTSPDRKRLLLGEVKAWRQPATLEALVPEVRRLRARALPRLAVMQHAPQVEWTLFVPAVAVRVPRVVEGVRIITLEELVQR